MYHQLKSKARRNSGKTEKSQLDRIRFPKKGILMRLIAATTLRNVYHVEK